MKQLKLILAILLSVAIVFSGFDGRVFADAETSTDLADFLTKVEIDAAKDSGGNYLINPNSEYKIKFDFAENEHKQFDDCNELTYPLPGAMDVSDVSGTFNIEVTDTGGTFIVEGNTFKVESGNLIVKFNQSDSDFSHLEAAGNAQFQVEIDASFDGSQSSVVFQGLAQPITFDFQNPCDLKIKKNGHYDKANGKVNYTVTVDSIGVNNNVVITDTTTGSAFVYDRNLSITSSSQGLLASPADFTVLEESDDGFKVKVNELTAGEKLTLEYTSTIDYDQINGFGSHQQTENTVAVSSDQVPTPKEAKHHLKDSIKFRILEKKRPQSGDVIDLPDNNKQITWSVVVNEDNKKNMAGKVIEDTVDPSNQNRMFFNGTGIHVKVTDSHGNLVRPEEDILWADPLLTFENNTDGEKIAWKYTVPTGDANYTYEITSTTKVLVKDAISNLNFTNRVKLEEHSAYNNWRFSPGTGLMLNAKKEVLEVTSEKIKWQVTVSNIPKDGLHGPTYFVDELPRITSGGNVYKDELIPTSLQVEGLIDNGGDDKEYYTLTPASGDGNTIVIRFNKNKHNDAGLRPSTDGNPRTIKIIFETKVNPEWLKETVNRKYASGTFIKEHKNSISFRTKVNGTQMLAAAQAHAIPEREFIRKEVSQANDTVINGVSYPTFRYELTLTGVKEESVVINDSFDKEYLKICQDKGITIKGVPFSGSPATGGDAALSVMLDGSMNMTLTNLPKNGSDFYPLYSVSYYLIVKDKAALDALNKKAADETDGYKLKNTATWKTLTSETSIKYTSSPYIGKKQLEAPALSNGFVAKFEIVVNPTEMDMDPNSDTITIKDQLSSNLRLKQDSIVIAPNVPGEVQKSYDAATNTFEFSNIPDGKKYTITYQAEVLGAVNQSTRYSNTVSFGNYNKTVEDTVVITAIGGGGASNPSITLVKKDGDNIDTVLPGAKFQLFEKLNNNQLQAVTDNSNQDVVFVTGSDGTVLIEGNMSLYGWVLWKNKTYVLKEVDPPAGYQNEQGKEVEFKLVDNPLPGEYRVTGDKLDVTNEREKRDVQAKKIWVGGPDADHTPPTFELYADGVKVEGVTPAIISNAPGQFTYTWENLLKYKAGSDTDEIVYTVKEAGVVNNKLTVGQNTYRVTFSQDGLTITNTKQVLPSGGGGNSHDDDDDDDDDDDTTTTTTTTTTETPGGIGGGDVPEDSSSGGGGGGGSVTTTTMLTLPSTGNQFFINNVPDPGKLGSPEVIVVLDEDGTVLGTYRKKQMLDGSFEWVDEEGVPLGTMALVNTGDMPANNNILLGAIFAMVAGAFFVLRFKKK